MASAARALRNNARVRRASTSSTVRAIWCRTAHTTSAPVYGSSACSAASPAVWQSNWNNGLNVTVVNCRYLKPYDEVTLAAVLSQHQRVLTVEEGTIVNGFGAYVSAIIERHDDSIRVQTLGVPDRIVVAASRARQLQQCGLSPEGIADRVRALLESEAIAG